MTKVAMPISNHFCPQTLFLYGTYREDGTPNFGLFCWISYFWEGELGVMACLGGQKLTKDRIRQTGEFSANLVTEALLPLADACGNIPGTDPAKRAIQPDTIPGQVLHVPILNDSPWSFELQVTREISLQDSAIFLCKIRNILADEQLADETKTIQERLQSIAPISTTCQTYFSFTGKSLGMWGEPQQAYCMQAG